MRVERRPHRSISKPLRNAPKGLAIDCTLAAIIHVDFVIDMILERALFAMQKLCPLRYIGYWWESQKEKDHWEDQDVDGWTILKWILER
jgi:hypothetical protein